MLLFRYAYRLLLSLARIIDADIANSHTLMSR